MMVNGYVLFEMPKFRQYESEKGRKDTWKYDENQALTNKSEVSHLIQTIKEPCLKCA
ncbi:hypothetical protein [Peribacillus kribbensis]|uniref:hypothetical protein n=1 Tax=Peribacillus kribbensis TaxID=356658 RepID=UPI000401AEB1|nr:hypothetical protein [Peribacillus kribbensis]